MIHISSISQLGCIYNNPCPNSENRSCRIEYIIYSTKSSISQLECILIFIIIHESRSTVGRRTRLQPSRKGVLCSYRYYFRRGVNYTLAFTRNHSISIAPNRTSCARILCKLLSSCSVRRWSLNFDRRSYQRWRKGCQISAAAEIKNCHAARERIAAISEKKQTTLSYRSVNMKLDTRTKQRCSLTHELKLGRFKQDPYRASSKLLRLEAIVLAA